MWRRWWKPSLLLIPWAVIVLTILYIIYRLVDPLPPRHFVIAAGIAGTGYDNFARQYARVLARDGVALEVRNYASSVEHFDVLRDSASGVQAAITSFGFTHPRDEDILFSLGGVSDSVMFIFSRTAEPMTQFAQFRGKRLAIGKPKTALRTLITEVLKATDALDASTRFADLEYKEAIEALIAGTIDVAVYSGPLHDSIIQRALRAPEIRLMNVAQAEAIAKTVPGLKHVVFWRGLASLPRDIPNADTDLLALRNRVLVRKDLHPALQYLLLKAMREVHAAPGPFNALGAFPAEQPNDLPLSPTAEAFYHSDPSFWQRYTSFWLTSLVNRIVFFVIPIVAMLIPVIGFAPRFYRWLYIRRIGRFHRALGKLERELDRDADAARILEYQTRLAEIESAVRLLKVARPFEFDLQILRMHLRMAQEAVGRMGVGNTPNNTGCEYANPDTDV
jgi:TRAP-type uncharacterized transport system substrate-binding protein